MPSAKQQIKPLALRPGDTVGVVAPASNIQRELLERGCARLKQMGYVPSYLPSIFDQDLYFAGSARRRARELEKMFQCDEVRAIVCARGGYGSNYLLEEIDLDIVRRHPKIFVGYSDITTLLTYFYDAAGLISFHGPMVTKDFAKADGIDIHSWNAAIASSDQWMAKNDKPLSLLKEGEAEGIIYGGCLSMLVASLRTSYEIQTAGKILFIEDIAAKPYQIDRMLKQLEFAGKFNGVKGIIFGEMVNCIQPEGQPYELKEVILRALVDLEIPMVLGFSSGHVTGQNVTLPLGVRARLTATAVPQLEILESATTVKQSLWS